MTSNSDAVRQAYYDRLARDSLAPLWTVLHALVSQTPTTPAKAFAWRYEEVLPLLMEAGELITAEEAVRRVLILENPAMPGLASITRTLYAGFQLILPNEVAPCHRHSQSALRFVIEGQGAYTAVDGERAVMNPFDLVITPNGRWHDHANDTDQRMIWLDGLDIPLVNALDASFADTLTSGTQHPKTLADGACRALWGSNLKPVRCGDLQPLAAPLFHYPYSQWRGALETAANCSTPDSHDGFRLEFSNPATGGPIMTTISAFCQKLPARFLTMPQRSTDGVIFVGVEGSGTIIVDGQQFHISPRDVVVAPSWSLRQIESETDLILFSYSDKSAQEKLGLWREDLYRE
ncbi:MAG: gentisate 1,2-dioxygenase [Sphingopyxis sp.]|nr:gentisate 1,2-dioxygenase [Sphingopyxis sp.]